MHQPPQSICLVRLSALGDVVLATALVQTLRDNLPGCGLTWITSAMTRELLRDLPDIDWVIVPRPMRAGDYLALRRRLRGRDFDVLLAAQASFRANLVHACVPARRKIGFDPARARDLHRWFIDDHIRPRDEHLAEGFLGFAEALGIPPEKHSRRMVLPLSEADRIGARGKAGQGRYFVVNPASSKAERTWQPERYAAVADHVARRSGWRIVLTGGGGAAETELARMVAARMQTPAVDLTGRTTVRELAAVLESAEGVLAPDTGPVHMAAALGTPVIGLYAVARAALAEPWRQSRYCVDRYPTAVETLLGRPAAQVGWHTRVHDPRAMALISVEEVCAQADRLIADRKDGPSR